MSAADTSQTVVHANLAGRRRRFCLRIGEIEDLERLCGAGIGAILLRVATHGFYAKDILEPLRLGLEGGGMGEPEATAIALRCAGRPLMEHAELAGRILTAAVSGVPPEGKEGAETTGDPATSPPFSPPAPPSASGPPTSGE